MEPQAQSNLLQINLKTRRTNTDVVQQATIDLKLTCQKEKIQQILAQLTSQGFPQSALQDDDWFIVLQLFCNPGCQKQLIQMIHNSPKKDLTLFDKMIRRIKRKSEQMQAFQSPTRVFIKIGPNEKYRNSPKLIALSKLQNIPNTQARLVLDGERIKQEENKEMIKFRNAEFNLKTYGGKEIAAWFSEYLIQTNKSPPAIMSLLQKTKGGKVNLTLTTLQKLDFLFDIKKDDLFIQTDNQKKLAQNQFKLYLGYKQQFISESVIKITHPSTFFSQIKQNIIHQMF